MPIDPASGAPVPLPERRWFCEVHRDQAEPGDLDPWRPSRLVMTPTGIRDLDADAAEAERMERELESRHLAREREQAQPGRKPTASPRSRRPTSSSAGASFRRDRDLMAHRRDRVAEHEGGHIAALVMLRGQLPQMASADRPAADLSGVVRLSFTHDTIAEAAEDCGLVFLSGPLAEGTAAPESPPDSAAPGDEGALAKLSQYLRLDKAGWEASWPEPRRSPGIPTTCVFRD